MGNALTKPPALNVHTPGAALHVVVRFDGLLALLLTIVSGRLEQMSTWERSLSKAGAQGTDMECCDLSVQ